MDYKSSKLIIYEIKDWNIWVLRLMCYFYCLFISVLWIKKVDLIFDYNKKNINWDMKLKVIMILVLKWILKIRYVYMVFEVRYK